MPNYTPYNLQTNFRPEQQNRENKEVNQLQALQQLASVPGIQERLAKLFGTTAGLTGFQQGGVDEGWSAAMRHESALNPDRNVAFQQLKPESEQINKFYANIQNPAIKAFEERQQLSDFLEKLYGWRRLPGPTLMSGTPLQ